MRACVWSVRACVRVCVRACGVCVRVCRTKPIFSLLDITSVIPTIIDTNLQSSTIFQLLSYYMVKITLDCRY